MGLLRVIAYPITKTIQMNARSKRLAFVYDIANRVIKEIGYPTTLVVGKRKIPTYVISGNKLMEEITSRNLLLRKASLEGSPEMIIEAIKAAVPGSENISIDRLRQLRIITQGKLSLKSRFYDTFVPIKSVRALDTLILGESQAKAIILADQIHSIENYQQLLIAKLQADLQRIKHLEVGHQAYLEIMNAIYKSGEGKSLTENIMEMFNVVTKWAYQVIGRSPDSESAGWLALGPDGKIGVTYKYVVAQEGMDINNAVVSTLRKCNDPGQSGVAIPEEQTTLLVPGDKGNFISIQEWDSLTLREDLVMIEKADGSRQLLKREIQSGSKLAGHLIRGMGLGKIMGAFAQAVTDVIGKVKNFDNAYIETTPIDPAHADIKPGEIIPFIQEGTIIKLVSAGSKKPKLREEKIKKGETIESMAEKSGIKIGIVNQWLERAIGNVRTAAVKPIGYMIKNVEDFKVRAQNNFLLSIVGVRSYFIRSLLEFNEQGDAICLGCLEVTNPEIIPEKLGTMEEKQLVSQFEAGKIFAELASTGIMIKLLQEEKNELSRKFLGEKIFQIIKQRDFAKLRGVRINNATIMFADISGFTALSDVLKDIPDKVVAMLSKIFSRLDPIIVRNGGIVDKHDGDAIMADFGVPERMEGDTEAAVTSAIELQTELQKINADPEMQKFYRDFNLKPLGMTIGLNTGTVIAGNLGHEGSKIEYSVIGDAVNQAARLQHAVIRGQILIGETTFDLLSEDYKSKRLAQFNLYNRDIVSLKEFISAEYKKTGRSIDETELDRKLHEYLELYKDAVETDLFVPAIIWAKNKGPIPSYFLRWDKHAYRYQFLKKAGIELDEKCFFENQPLLVEETFDALAKETDPIKMEQLDIAYRRLLHKHGMSP